MHTSFFMAAALLVPAAVWGEIALLHCASQRGVENQHPQRSHCLAYSIQNTPPGESDIQDLKHPKTSVHECTSGLLLDCSAGRSLINSYSQFSSLCSSSVLYNMYAFNLFHYFTIFAVSLWDTSRQSIYSPLQKSHAS